MRNFYSLVLMFLFAVTVQSQTTTIWLGGSTEWEDPTNWTDGVPETGFLVTIPANPPNGNNFPIFSGGPLLDFSIQSFGGTITFNSVVYNTGSIVNSGGGSLINNSIFINAGMVTFNNNDGTFFNNGTVDNYGTFNNAGTSILENPAGSVFNNYGNIDNFGTINNGGDLLNNGNLVSTSNIQNNGNLTNNGFMDIAFGGTFDNGIGATIINSSGAFVEVNTAFTNAGSITSDGSWFVQVGSTLFDNSGDFTSNGRLDISGLFNNTGTLVNTDEVSINDSGILDNYNIFTNNGTVTLSVCGQLIQNANNDIVGTILNDGIVYQLDGSVGVTSNLEFGSEFIDLSQRKVPDTKCRSGMIVFLDENGMGSIDIDAVDKNSYGFCGASLVSRVLSQSNFTVADLGVNQLTLTTTDNFGFSSSCISFITVVDYFPPVVDVDDPEIDFNCPTDIMVTTLPGASSEVVSWTTPIATTTCTSGIGLAECSTISNNISGATYLGEFGNSKFFVTTEAQTWTDARNFAEANFGHLAVIDSYDENEFILNSINPASGSVWVGLNNVGSGNVFNWVTGDSVSYTNWENGEPNGAPGGHGVRLKKSNGKWTDKLVTDLYEVVFEVPCFNVITCEDVNVNITFDSYPEDISWVINDDQGNSVASGGNYGNAGSGSTVNITNCLADGCYDFIITDNYGDGLCCSYGNGSWSISNSDGTVYGSGAQFSNSETANFCISIDNENIPPVDSTGGLAVSQITGGSSGQPFPIGENAVSYAVTDNCGNEEICTFLVTVLENPADITVTDCPSDITINTSPGAPAASASWNPPSATTDCYKPNTNIIQTIGQDSGSDFLIGSHNIAYSITDSCGNFMACSFNVIINEVVASMSLDQCPGDQNIQVALGETSGIATWDTPTGISDCYQGSVQAFLLTDLTSGSLFPLGVNQVVYVLTDECGNSSLCAFNITVSEECPVAGLSCDDGDASTENDLTDGLCGCLGTPCPIEGIVCDDGDATTENDVEDGNCNCVGTPCPLAGTTCDDGDATTENDMADGTCGCAGTPILCPDAGEACDDEDASTENDIEDGNCNCSGTPCPMEGTVCDDGDATTENDVADGTCGCAGTPIVVGCSITENLSLKPIASATQSSTQLNATANRAIDGNTNGDFFGGNSVSLTNWESNAWWEIDLGLVSNVETINIFNREDCCQQFLSNYYIFISDAPFNSTDLNETLNQVGVSNYLQVDQAGLPSAISIDAVGRYIRIQLVGTSFLGLTEVEVIGCISGSGCAPAGTVCDDGDATTENDVEDGNCGCAGIPCPIQGTICDDGNASTENDIADGSCGCSGTPIGGGCAVTENLALNGTATESSFQLGADGNRAIDGDTNGDFFAGNSVSLTNWTAQPWIEVDLGEIGNIETINVWNRTDCCNGFLKDYYILVSDDPFTSTDLASTLTQTGVDNYFESDIASLPSAIQINRTGRYVRIQLQGTSFLGLAELEIVGCNDGGGCPIEGTTCDDGDATTENDVEDGNCGCAGTPCPTVGTTCDDGDSTTENDMEDGSCNCAGTPINCPDIGTTCDDGDSTTENDVEDGNCNCSGTPCPTEGTTCDDGDATTENDMEDGNCNCAGTPISLGCMTTSNLALTGTTSQSSTLIAGGITGNSDKAIDGNTNGIFFTSDPSNSSVTATNNESQPFWEIELDASYLIEQIDIYNRTDGVDQTNNVYVLISDVPFTASDLAGARAEAIWEEFIPGLVGTPSTVLPNLVGKYVRIQMEGSGYLVLAEVEVIGCTDPTPAGYAIPNMLYFNAKKNGIYTNVDWLMAKDVTVDFYEVEVSRDGIVFSLLDEINAAQVNSPRQYEMIDLKPSYGENYYRLKVNQLDGSHFYSNIRRVNFEIDFDNVIIFPNPTFDNLNIDMRDFAGKSGTIEIYNNLGQKMKERTYLSFPSNPVEFDVSGFTNGLFTISIKVDNHRRFTKKFIVNKL